MFWSKLPLSNTMLIGSFSFLATHGRFLKHQRGPLLFSGTRDQGCIGKVALLVVSLCTDSQCILFAYALGDTRV
jgi:hypothetical protein